MAKHTAAILYRHPLPLSPLFFDQSLNARISETLRSPAAWLCFLGTFIVGLSADLLFKSLAAATRVEISNADAAHSADFNLVRLEYTENRGAVFGIGQGQRALFLIVSVAAVAFLFYLFSDQRANVALLSRSFSGMLMAGVLGNMYDRLNLGYVRDMIHGLPGVACSPAWIMQPHAASSLAPGHRRRPHGSLPLDLQHRRLSLLCVGVFFMIVYSFLTERKRS